MAEFHQENFRSGDSIMSDKSGDNILLVDEQIHQWVFAHDNRGRKVELDCVNGNVWHALTQKTRDINGNVVGKYEVI